MMKQLKMYVFWRSSLSAMRLRKKQKKTLDELDTDGVEPLSHIFGDQNVFREDVVTNGDNKEAMLANAPKAKEGQYQVPKTIG